MTDIRFDKNEEILLQTTDVYRYDGRHEQEILELYLTNKNLISVCGKSKIYRIPLSSIRVVNGNVQVSQIEDDDYGTVLQIIYKNGKRELFELDGFGRQYTKWVSAITNAVQKAIELNFEFHEEDSSQSLQDTCNTHSAPAQETSSCKPLKTRHDVPVFCDNCFSKIGATAKFCPECGTKRNNGSTNLGQRQIIYDGIVHKCPNCGEILNAFEIKCTTCGYELRDSASSAIVQKFVAEIRQLEEDNDIDAAKRMATFISTFPIPNTREDLLEFFVLSASNINTKVYGLGSVHISEEEKVISSAYYTKFEQIFRKAQAVFEGSDYFEDFATIYHQKLNEISKVKRKRRRTVLSIIFGSIAAFFVTIGIIICLSIPISKANTEKIDKESARLDAIVQEVYAAIEDKNYTLAEAKAATIVFSGPSSQKGLEEKEKWDKVRQDLLSAILGAQLEEQLNSCNTPDATAPSTELPQNTLASTESTPVQDVLHNINITIDCEKNLLFSTYDILFYIDGISQGTINHGDVEEFSVQLSAGKHMLKFESKDDDSVVGEAEIEISRSENFSFSLSCSSSDIDISIEINDFDNNRDSTSNEDHTASSSLDSVCEAVTIERYTFNLPHYWEEEGSKDEYQQYYAEKGDRCVILGIGYPKETDDTYVVSFDGLFSDNANMIDMIEKTLPEAQVTNYEVFVSKNGVKGLIYKFTCNIEITWYKEVAGNGYLFCFPSERDRRWFYFWYMQTDNVSESNYIEDYFEMLSTLKEL